MAFLSTRQVARVLGVTVNQLQRGCWDGRIKPPEKTPAGNFLWTIDDIQRASWVLLRQAFEVPSEMLAMVNNGPVAL